MTVMQPSKETPLSLHKISLKEGLEALQAALKTPTPPELEQLKVSIECHKNFHSELNRPELDSFKDVISKLSIALGSDPIIVLINTGHPASSECYCIPQDKMEALFPKTLSLNVSSYYFQRNNPFLLAIDGDARAYLHRAG